MTSIFDSLTTAEIEEVLKTRFQNPQRFKRSAEDPEGLTVIMTTENGNVMLDFGEPIQTLGLTVADLRGFVVALVHAGAFADHETKAQAN